MQKKLDAFCRATVLRRWRELKARKAPALAASISLARMFGCVGGYSASVKPLVGSPEISGVSLAKSYAKRADVNGCLQCLGKGQGRELSRSGECYKDEDFSRMWENPKLHELVVPPIAK